MVQFQCPNCGSRSFYVKNPDDEHNRLEFEYRDGKVIFGVWIDEDDRPKIDDDTNMFCNVCAWQGKRCIR